MPLVCTFENYFLGKEHSEKSCLDISKREQEIILFTLKGKSNNDIMKELFISLQL